MPQPIRIATFGHKRDTTPEHIETTLAELARYEHEEREEKDGPLFGATEYRSGASRANTNALRLHLLVLDLDHITHERAHEILESIIDQGLEMWAYSTFSYDEAAPNGATIRVVLSLERPATPEEWPAFWGQAVYEIAPESDPARKDLAGMYYLPRCRPGAERVHLYSPGTPIDVDAVLSRGRVTRGRKSTAGDNYTAEARAVVPAIDDTMREWALGRVQALARGVERAPCPGPIYPTLNHAAFTAGRFVPHVLTHDVVREMLHNAHAKRNPNAIEKNDAILDRGIADGVVQPWRPARPYELTDEGLSDRLLDEHGEHLRYVAEWQKWIGYDGQRWGVSGDGAPAFLAMRKLTSALRDEAAYVGGPRAKALLAAARATASARGAAAVIRMATPLPRFRIRLDELDVSPMLLGCANGTIDLRNATLRDHDATHYIAASTRIAYDPDAPCPSWDRFLREVCCDDLDLVRYLQRAVGYTLTGHTTEQCLFFLYGSGANGKSTFLGVLQRLLGEYATTCSADLILTKRHEQHPTAIAALHGKRLAVVGEVDDGRSWDEATVKNLTGSDVVTARRMREDPWTFEPRHKLWIAGNYRPGVRGADNGIWRRMRLIPFDADFRRREDKELMRKLVGELPGILAWAARGCVAWQREGLEMPERVASETQAYRDEQDFFRAFVEETFDTGRHDEERVSRSQVVQLFTQWQIRNGAPTLGARAIAERLRTYGVGEHKAGGVPYWTKIRVRPRNYDAVASKPS